MKKFLAAHRDSIVPGTTSFLITSFVQLYPMLARLAL